MQFCCEPSLTYHKHFFNSVTSLRRHSVGVSTVQLLAETRRHGVRHVIVLFLCQVRFGANKKFYKLWGGGGRRNEGNARVKYWFLIAFLLMHISHWRIKTTIIISHIHTSCLSTLQEECTGVPTSLSKFPGTCMRQYWCEHTSHFSGLGLAYSLWFVAFHLLRQIRQRQNADKSCSLHWSILLPPCALSCGQ